MQCKIVQHIQAAFSWSLRWKDTGSQGNLPLRRGEAKANSGTHCFRFLPFTHLLGRENLIAFNIITEEIFFFNLNVAYHEDISKEKV